MITAANVAPPKAMVSRSACSNTASDQCRWARRRGMAGSEVRGGETISARGPRGHGESRTATADPMDSAASCARVASRESGARAARSCSAARRSRARARRRLPGRPSGAAISSAMAPAAALRRDVSSLTYAGSMERSEMSASMASRVRSACESSRLAHSLDAPAQPSWSIRVWADSTAAATVGAASSRPRRCEASCSSR